MFIFLQIKYLHVKFSLLPQPAGLLKLMLNLFCTITIQGRELCWCDFMKYMFNSVMCQDICEPICVILGMLLNTTKLYCLIPVWMTLMFTQGHRVRESWNLCSHCVVKLHEAAQLFMMVDYVRKMTVKKSCKYGEYGLFERLLFSFCMLLMKLKLNFEH